MWFLYRQTQAVSLPQVYRQAPSFWHCHRLHRLARELSVSQGDTLRATAYYRYEQMEQYRSCQLLRHILYATHTPTAIRRVGHQGMDLPRQYHSQGKTLKEKSRRIQPMGFRGKCHLRQGSFSSGGPGRHTSPPAGISWRGYDDSRSRRWFCRGGSQASVQGYRHQGREGFCISVVCEFLQRNRPWH